MLPSIYSVVLQKSRKKFTHTHENIANSEALHAHVMTFFLVMKHVTKKMMHEKMGVDGKNNAKITLEMKVYLMCLCMVTLVNGTLFVNKQLNSKINTTQ